MRFNKKKRRSWQSLLCRVLSCAAAVHPQSPVIQPALDPSGRSPFFGDEGSHRAGEIPINHKYRLRQIDNFLNADGLLPNCFLKTREK